MTQVPAAAELLVGEVVDPGKVIICEAGKTASARSLMDRRGEYGGVVRESDVCPKGSVVVIDSDLLEENLEARPLPLFVQPEPRWDMSARLAFKYGSMLVPQPSWPSLITGA